MPLLVVHQLVPVALLELRQLLLFGGWVRGCARLSLVHSGSPYLWAGAGGAGTPAGPNNCRLGVEGFDARQIVVVFGFGRLGLEDLVHAVFLDTLGILVGVEDHAALSADD